MDSQGIWVQTLDKRRFGFFVAMDPGQVHHGFSAELDKFDGQSDMLTGWSHSGWQSSGKSIQVQVRIPWSVLGTSAPKSGSRFRINFVDYNQTAAKQGSPASRDLWVNAGEAEADKWAEMTFDELPIAGPTDVSSEAVLTLRPQTGIGADVTLSPGDNADKPNLQSDAILTQSDWNDWDATQYMLKAFYQFDLSMIPPDRTVISATLATHCRGPYNDQNSEQGLQAPKEAGRQDSNDLAPSLWTKPEARSLKPCFCNSL